MKILISGINGFVGRALTKDLQGRGHWVDGFDLQNKNKCGAHEYFTQSVLDPNIARNGFDGYDVVVHAACLLGVALTEKRPQYTISLIIDGTRNMIDGCISTLERPRFVYLSSSEIFGDPARGIHINEDMKPSPLSPYAAAKLCAGHYVKAYPDKWSVVIPYNLYGAGQRNDFVVKKMMQRAIVGETIPVYGNGSQVRSFCYIDDFAEGLAKIVEGGADGHVVNLGNPEPCRMQALAVNIKTVVCQVFGRCDSEIINIPYEQSDRKESREIGYRVPDISWARQYLDWSPDTTLEQGLRKMMEEMR